MILEILNKLSSFNKIIMSAQFRDDELNNISNNNSQINTILDNSDTILLYNI